MYLKKGIDNTLTLFKGRYFPYKAKQCKAYRYSAVIGIGGNVGDTKRVFEKLFALLQKERIVSICKTSSILKNPPFGYLEQPYFYNAVMIVKSNLEPHKLLRYLLHMEKRFRRKRSFKDAPRTLDLDILFFDDRVINSDDLIIPHKEWHKRESVLIPLMEVNSL